MIIVMTILLVVHFGIYAAAALKESNRHYKSLRRDFKPCRPAVWP